MKTLKVIIDFSDELVRQLSGEVIKRAVRQFIESESCTDIAGAANLLGLSISETRKHAKRWPVVNLGERSHRYRIKDVLAYRDRCTIIPKA